MKQYTPWRRFLAWVGFVHLILWVVLLIAFLVWANHFIDANLYTYGYQG